MESVGFKEWALVCDALARGEQTIILRKGGIAEGRDGFSFRHQEFFLFPTFFHEQVEKVRGTRRELCKANGGDIQIQLLAKLELAAAVKSFETAMALEPFHILQPEVVRERFAYDTAPVLQVAFVRVFRFVPLWSFPNERRFGGCRSWVQLPPLPAETRLEPVLQESEHRARFEGFRAILAREIAATT